MTRLNPASLAVNADYADALLTARRARSWAFLLLMLFLIIQIAIFFLVRYDVIRLGSSESSKTSLTLKLETPTTAESTATTQETITTPPARVDKLASYATGVIVFLGMALSIILAIVLLLIVLTMLQGRLLGVAHVTSAFIWAVVLIVLLMPWQRYYSGDTGPDDFRLPGVMYTWPELSGEAHFTHDNMGSAVLKYVRFVGAPLAALIVLFMVQAKSGRGLKYALGEMEVKVDVLNA